MHTAALIFCLAAIGGVSMVVLRLRGHLRPPTWLALAHGAVALTGFSLLVNAWTTTGLPTYARVATVIFGFAALGGATLFLGFHVRGRALPLGLMLAHGFVAASALATLLIGLALGSRTYVPTVVTPATHDAPGSDTTTPSGP